MNVLERIQPALANLAANCTVSVDRIVCLEVGVRDVLNAVARLRHATGFDTCTFVTAVDRFPAEPRFEVLWQLYSLKNRDRVRIRTRVGGADPHVPSIVHHFPGAAFFERECFDLFGVVFDGHEGLKRLLMPEDYDHFPLRKDFPHQGIEPERLYREWDRDRHRSARTAP